MSTRNIMIVDDDASFCKTLSDILRAKGYAPVSATTGGEALAIVQKERPEIALIDLKLGDMPGLKLMEEIKEYSSDTECIVLMGNASKDSAIKAVSLGAYVYVQKPYDIEYLLLIIYRAMEKVEGKRKLHETEEKHSVYIKNAPYGIFVADSSGRYIEVNRAACQMTGYSREELLSMTLMALASPNQTTKSFDELKEKGRVDTEVMLRRKDGTDFCSSIKSVALSDDRFMAFCFDITEYKRAEERILEMAKFPSENPNPVLRVTSDGTIRYTNAASLRLQSLLGFQVNQRLSGQWRELILDVLRSGSSKDIEVEGEDSSAFLLSFTPIVEAGYVNIYGRDVAEHKRTDKKLRDSEERFKQFFEYAPEYCYIISPEAVILDINNTALETLGYEKRELIGKPMGMIYAPESQPRMKLLFEQFLRIGYIENEEMTVITKTGNKYIVLFSIEQVKDRNGRILYAMSIQRDITEHKHAVKLLQESEEKYRALVENASEIILVIQNGMLKFFNSRTTEILGYSEDELLSTYFTDIEIVHRDDQEMMIEHNQTILRGEKCVRDHCFRFLDKAGNTRWFDINSTLITWENKPATLNILSDVTERKHMEKALQEERSLLAKRVDERTSELQLVNKKLAKSARLKDEFLASMSHELRTPLTAILGMSEVLQIGIHGPLNEKQLSDLLRIEESGRHLLNLINDILDVSRIEAGKLELEEGIIYVEPFCEACLRFIKTDAVKNQISISLSVNKTVTVIRADERRLKQIIVNLLSNAVKFTPAGGSIGLEAAGDMEQKVFCFTVWDTGIGIPEDQLENMFQPFTQLDSSLSRQYAGTGLGLALVARLVDLHGGSISVESEVGKGSRFTVSVLLKEAVWTEQRPAIAEPAGPDMLVGTQMNLGAVADGGLEIDGTLILIADDNEGSINVISDYLLILGYRVVLACNGEKAIQQVRVKKPDLILMDIQMPVMDGLEAIRRIRADKDLADIPIIALTALAMRGDRERCLEAGANDYIIKPVHLKDLAQAIKAQLRQEPVAMEGVSHGTEEHHSHCG